MTNSARAQKRTADFVTELIEIYHLSPQAFPAEDLARGQKHLTIYEDSTYSLGFQNQRDLRRHVLLEAIHDLSTGGRLFRGGSFVIYFANNKLGWYHKRFEETPLGELVYSISWQSAAAAHKAKKDIPNELATLDLHHAILHLIRVLSQLTHGPDNSNKIS